jgi:hypothetical protein
VPEVTFSVLGERGAIDVLGWHAATRTVLVIELKTDIVDVQEMLGTLDRKRRPARGIARDRGWDAAVVATSVILAEGRTNRRRVEAHATVLRAAPPDDGRTVGPWLRAPRGPMAALSIRPDSHEAARMPPVRRVRVMRRAAGADPRA